MSLLLSNLIINNFMEEELENDSFFLSIDSYNDELELLDKKALILDDVLNKKNGNLNATAAKKKLNYFFLKKSKNYKTITNVIEDSFVLYSIAVSFLQKNVTIHVMDMKGLLKVFCSSVSSLKLSSRNRKIQPKIVSDLLKYFLEEVLYFNDEVSRVPITLYLRNVKKNYISLIIKKLKLKFEIKTINLNHSIPHNGCRPRKIRRVKQRKKKLFK